MSQEKIAPSDLAPPPRPSRAGRNLSAAIAVGVGLFGAVVATLAWWNWGFVLLVAVALSLGVVELHQAMQRVGARSEVAEGVIVGEGSVLSMGVFLGASTKIIDRATGEVFMGHVPPYSVVVPGSLPGKPLPDGTPGPSLYCAVIVKRVDAQTRSKTSINELLRD